MSVRVEEDEHIILHKDKSDSPSSVESSCHNVAVIFEDPRPVVSQVVLNIKTSNDPGEEDTRL